MCEGKRKALSACLKNGLLVAQATRLFGPATRRTERERRIEPMEIVFSRRCSRHPFSKQALTLDKFPSLEGRGVGLARGFALIELLVVIAIHRHPCFNDGFWVN